MPILDEISQQLQLGRASKVIELVEQALDGGIPAGEILDGGLLAGMAVIGEKFKRNDIFVPEVLVAARARNAGSAALKPHLVREGERVIGRVCLGTVQGDIHDIGKNLVRMMMEASGLEVIDLGVDVPAERFAETAAAENCQIICCSALLTTTIAALEDVVRAVERAGLRDRVKIMVGGAPVTDVYCRQIGADYYTPDAVSAAELAVKLCSAQNGD